MLITTSYTQSANSALSSLAGTVTSLSASLFGITELIFRFAFFVVLSCFSLIIVK